MCAKAQFHCQAVILLLINYMPRTDMFFQRVQHEENGDQARVGRVRRPGHCRKLSASG